MGDAKPSSIAFAKAVEEENEEDDDYDDRLRSDDVVNCICQINEENGLMIQVLASNNSKFMFMCSQNSLWLTEQYSTKAIIYLNFSVMFASAGNMLCAWKSQKTHFQRNMSAMCVVTLQVTFIVTVLQVLRINHQSEKVIFLQCVSGVRESARFSYDQDWLRQGTMARFNFLPEELLAQKKSEIMQATHELVADLLKVQKALIATRNNLHYLQ